MNIEELRKIVKEKLTLKEGEFEELVRQAREELKEIGIPDDQMEKAIVSKVFAILRKQLLSSAEVYVGIVLGAGEVTDYGAKRMFDQIKEKWEIASEDIRKEMIAKGEVDKEGNPLWNASNTSVTWRYQDDNGNLLPVEQRRIRPERDRVRPLIGLFAKYKEEKPEYKPAFINLYGEQTKLEVPMFRLVKVRFTGRFDENMKSYFLNSSTNTEFIVEKNEKLTFEEYTQIVRNYFSNYTIDLESENVKEELKKKFDGRLVFLLNAITIRCQETTGRNNIVDIGSIRLGFDDESIITCWLPKTYQLPVEGVNDTIVCGIPVNGERLSINCFSIFQKFSLEKPKPIPEEEQKVENTEHEQQGLVW